MTLNVLLGMSWSLVLTATGGTASMPQALQDSSSTAVHSRRGRRPNKADTLNAAVHQITAYTDRYAPVSAKRAGSNRM